MYLLLAAHPDGAAILELTAAGLPHPANPEPRVVPLASGRETAPQPGAAGSGTGLAAVVRELEKRRPRWIWHRTQDWYPSLLAAGVDVERCYDLSLCGAILAHSEFTAHTAYARNAEKLTQDDDLQPPRLLQPPPPPADQGALFDDPGAATEPRQSLAELRPNMPPSRRPWQPPPETGTDGSGSSSSWPPSRPAPWSRPRCSTLACPGVRSCTSGSWPITWGRGPRRGTGRPNSKP